MTDASDIAGRVRLFNGDCMEWMETVPDKWYDIAIVDPPYGLPRDSSNGRGKLKHRAFNTGNIAEKWDVKPNKDYFDELFRISKNQIIWGGNYFELPPCRCFVCWDKVQPWENFSQVEMAWTSFNKPAKIFRCDNRNKGKIHPTEKPVALYAYLLRTFAKEGDRVFDSHFGSLSIGLACHDLGFQLDACELDKEYYEKALKRLKDHQANQSLFKSKTAEAEEVQQTSLF